MDQNKHCDYGIWICCRKVFYIRPAIIISTRRKKCITGKGYSPLIGIALVVIGAVMALLAFIRYRNIEKHLTQGTYFLSFTLSLLMPVAI
jgi:putative membrane protein